MVRKTVCQSYDKKKVARSRIRLEVGSEDTKCNMIFIVDDVSSLETDKESEF